MKDIFGGNGTVEAIYGISSGSSIVFSDLYNASAADQVGLGFMIDTYSINWSRPAIMKRMFNMSGRLAIVGAGNGVLQLSGLVGAADLFEKLISNTGGTNVCNMPVCTIDASSGFARCESGVETTETESVEIVCKGILLTQLTLTGQITDNSTLMTTANLGFLVSGVDINKKTKTIES